ncbi:MAG: GGDEF protein [uncultured bacterium]|nr:MAG: GGDEF protein [uncultured bacterium]
MLKDTKTEPFLFVWWLDLSSKMRTFLRVLLSAIGSIAIEFIHSASEGNALFQKPNFIMTFIAFFFFISTSLMLTTILRDKKEHVLMNEKLIRLTKIDPLTELYNQRFIPETIRKLIKHASKRTGEYIFCIKIDVDDFKTRINDVFGHEAGDQVLKQVATRLTKILQADDTIFRDGGDEFRILTLCSDPAGLENVLSNKLGPFSVLLDEELVPVSLSFGFASVPIEVQIKSEEQLLAFANIVEKTLHEESDHQMRQHKKSKRVGR